MRKISVIVPTYNRQQHFRNVVFCFLSQRYPDTELLIYDDSPQPSDYLQAICREHGNIRYFHSSQRLTIGEKRNFLIQQATGELIAHFDDDDFYAPTYLQTLADYLERHELNFLTISNWFAYSVKHDAFAYWETDRIAPMHCKLSTEGMTWLSREYFPVSDDFTRANQWGYGFSYFFHRRVFEQVQYQPINSGEDYDFYQRLVAAGFRAGCLPDAEGLVLHVIHQSNTSLIFPQYILPSLLMEKLFPGIGKFLANVPEG